MLIESYRKIRRADKKSKGICDIHVIHVKINDVNARAKEMVRIISDTSWIKRLDSIGKATFKARAEKTIVRLVNEVIAKVEDTVTSEFGEYMISDTAQCVLAKKCGHKKVPLAELLKEKVVGNMGFDFHGETTGQLIAFGESKFSGSDNPYTEASVQILEFIDEKKDLAELLILRAFVSRKSLKNIVNDKKAFAAAFSMNSTNPTLIFENALRSDSIKQLFRYPELYLIGVEVND